MDGVGRRGGAVWIRLGFLTYAFSSLSIYISLILWLFVDSEHRDERWQWLR